MNFSPLLLIVAVIVPVSVEQLLPSEANGQSLEVNLQATLDRNRQKRNALWTVAKELNKGVVRPVRDCNGGCGGGGCGGGGSCGGGGGGGCGGGGGGGGCSNGNYNNNRGGGRGKSDARSRAPAQGTLSLRELLVLLPLLSPARAPPLAPPTGLDLAGGAMAQLARTVVRRQVGTNPNNFKANQAELRNQLRRIMMEEARRMASIVVTPHPMFGQNLAVPTTTIPPRTTTGPRTTAIPASEFVDDYDPVIPPVVDLAKGKVSPGDPCYRDSECVPGARCQRGAVSGMFTYCVCIAPLLGFDGRCVMPGSPGMPGR